MTDDERVLAQIEDRRTELVALAQDLVRTPSVSGDEGKVQQFVAQFMRANGLSVDVWEPDIDALRRHPGFVPVEGDYRGRPNVVGKQPGTGAEFYGRS